jgi:hypothetical protein
MISHSELSIGAVGMDLQSEAGGVVAAISSSAGDSNPLGGEPWVGGATPNSIEDRPDDSYSPRSGQPFTREGPTSSVRLPGDRGSCEINAVNPFARRCGTGGSGTGQMVSAAAGRASRTLLLPRFCCCAVFATRTRRSNFHHHHAGAPRRALGGARGRHPEPFPGRILRRHQHEVSQWW